MLRRIAIFDEDELPPELRAQRTLNGARIPEIADYILDNPDDYVFSAITVSIDSQVSFEPLPGQDRLGLLRVPMDARFIINDGQHCRAAIIEALSDRPELAHETIAVVFFLDIGLERCQQMFGARCWQATCLRARSARAISTPTASPSKPWVRPATPC